MSVAVDQRCTGCGACLTTCPERALVAARHHPLVLLDRCTTCLACVEVCPSDAIRVVRWPAREAGPADTRRAEARWPAREAGPADTHRAEAR